MDIAIDFDGTCVTHEYPDTGKEIGAKPILKQLVKEGHKLILFTMRSGQGLEEAAKWFLVNNIPLHGIQYNPSQTSWTASNKCYAQLYIDDAALGCPLIYPTKGRPYVDWSRVKELLIEKKILNP